MDTQKTMLVTGCSRGIGLEIARQALKDSWKVIGTARNTAFPDDLKANKSFTGIHLDLADISNLAETIKPLLKKYKPAVLINNAGMFTDADFQADDESWLDVWDQTMTVNLKSASLISKWFIGLHLDGVTKGRIINIASRASYRGDTQEYAAYAASKAGLVAVTKSIARDFSQKGIVAYSIAPGFIETDMARDAVELLGKDYITKDSVFDEITQPGEVAELALFLASGKVPHATGQTFHINGGSYMI